MQRQEAQAGPAGCPCWLPPVAGYGSRCKNSISFVTLEVRMLWETDSIQMYQGLICT